MEENKSKLAPDELYLQGRLQMMTAQQALSITGVNPGIESHMACRVKALEPYNDATARKDLQLYGKKGREVAKIKADVVESLRVMASYEDCPEDWRIAARELLTIMGITDDADLENE